MWSNGFYQFSFRESPRCEAILHFLGIPGKRHHWQLEFGWGNDSPRSEMCATHAKWQVGRLFRKLPGGRQSSGHKNIFVQIICALNYAEYFDTYLHTLRATDKLQGERSFAQDIKKLASPKTRHATQLCCHYGGCVLIFITDFDSGARPEWRC